MKRTKQRFPPWREAYFPFFRVFCGLLFLVLCAAASAQELHVTEVVSLCLKNNVDDFIALEKRDGFWCVKAVNQNNGEKCELRINKTTGIIEYCINVTPKDIVLGENTYGFSGKIYYEKDSKFYSSGQIGNGFEIFFSDDRYLQMRQAIFIKNFCTFVAYFMYKGPDVIRSRK